MRKKVSSYRLSDKTLEQLKELSDIYNIEITSLIERIVDSEWLKTTEIGQKKLKDINKNMQSMITQLSTLLTKGEHK